MMISQNSAAAHVGPFQLIILVLSLVGLAAVGADTVLDLPTPVHNLIQLADTAICFVLLGDFFIRFYSADSKLEFMKWGWIDLISSIPAIDVLRWGRLVRVLRVIRLLRGIRSVHRVFIMVTENRMQGGVASLALMAFLLVTFASVSILVFERQGGSNIKTAEDAIWWSVTTMTTVGYGDKFPVTTEGRVVGVIMMVCGVGLFGAISGIVASLFLGKRDSEEKDDTKEILRRLESMEAMLKASTPQRQMSEHNDRSH